MSFLFNLLKRQRQAVAVPYPPVASFTVAGAFPNYTFTDTSQAVFGSITKWFWTFGDGNSTSTQSPGYTYESAGIRTVTLTVTNTAGGTDTASVVLN